MTIYIPLLYICLGLKCQFLQANSYSVDENSCLQVVQQKEIELISKGYKVDTMCVSMKVANDA